MTCQECELLLGGDNLGDRSDASVDDHLRGCARCRALREDLQANALALSSLKDDGLPRVKVLRRQPTLPWLAATAAALLLVLIAHQASKPRLIVETHPQPRQM